MVLYNLHRVDLTSSRPIILPHLRCIWPRRSHCQINDGNYGGAPLKDQDLLVGYPQVPVTSPKPDLLRDNDILRYQRVNPESSPLANGGGSGVTRRSVEEERDPAVDADAASLAVFFARASLDNHGLENVSHQLENAAAHTSQGPDLGGGLYTLAAATQAPNLGGGMYVFADPAIQGPNLGGGSSSSGGIAAPDAAVLQWGGKKGSRGRRDKHAPAPAATPAPAPAPAPAPVPAPAATLAPEPELTPVQTRRRSNYKNKNPAAAQTQSQAEEEKLMPPPSARGPVIIRDTSPLPPRAATRSHRRSVEEPHIAAGGEQLQPAAKGKGKGKQPQGQASDKTPHHAGGSGEQHRAPKGKQPYEAGGSGDGEQEQPAPEVEPEQPQPRRRLPRRKASAKEKGKAPVAPPHVVEKAVAAAAEAVAAMERPPCPRVVVELTREEIAEDWLAMTGTKLPKRPHHRRPKTKAAQEIFDNTFPGQNLFWAVNRRDYRIPGKNSKKPQDNLKEPAEKDDSC